MSRTTLLLFLTIALAGCPAPNVTNPDTGVGVDGGTGGDGGNADLAGKPDMVVAAINSGTKLVTGKNFQLNFLSADDQVEFFDANSLVSVIPAAGGTITNVSSAAGAVNSTDGKIVMAFENWNDAARVGDLTVYTVAHGVQVLSPNSVNIHASSDDGENLLHTNNANVDGSTADIVIGKTDGTGLKIVFANTMMASPCQPSMAFAGGNFWVTHCDAAVVSTEDMAGSMADMTAPPADMTISANNTATLSKVTPAGVATVVKTGLQPGFIINKTGDKIMVRLGTNDDISVIDGTGAVLSTTAEKNAIDMTFTNDGALIFSTTGRDLKRWSNYGAAAVTLVSGTFNEFRGTSPDFKFVTFDTMDPVTANNSSDVYLSSLVTPGTPTGLVTTQNGAIYGDAFTRDSSRVLYYTNVTTFVGTLTTQPVGGGATTQHGVGVWSSIAGEGTKVWYTDNIKANGADYRGDLKITDVANTNAPALIATQVDINDSTLVNGYLTTSDGKRVVYVWTQVLNKEGIYSAPAP